LPNGLTEVHSSSSSGSGSSGSGSSGSGSSGSGSSCRSSSRITTFNITAMTRPPNTCFSPIIDGDSLLMLSIFTFLSAV
jgi:hypothetical protein